jgi:hypothetical protein
MISTTQFFHVGPFFCTHTHTHTHPNATQSPGPGAYNVRRFAEYPPPSLSSAEENAAALVAGAVLLTEVHTVRGERKTENESERVRG